jgi:hypothetical protein
MLAVCIYMDNLSSTVADCDFTTVVVLRNAINHKKYIIISIVYPTYTVYAVYIFIYKYT